MIIEIALGIVLAVLILMFFDVILAFALIALGVAVVLAIVGVAIYFAFTEPLPSGFIAGAAALIGVAAYLDAKRSYKNPPLLERVANYPNKRFGPKLLGAFFSALLTLAMASIFGAIAAIDLIQNGVRRDGDLVAPIYWTVYGLFGICSVVAIFYARAYWRILKTPAARTVSAPPQNPAT